MFDDHPKPDDHSKVEETLVTVRTVTTISEADAFRALLADDGVDLYIIDGNTVAMDWMLGNAIGYIKLQTPSSQVERALEIFAEFDRRRAEAPPLAEDEGICLSCRAPMDDEAIECAECGWSYADDDGDEGEQE